MNNKAALAALLALAFETRLNVVGLLAEIGPEGLPAGELSRRLGVQQNTLSDHLAILVRAEMISAERRGRSIIYRANSQALNDLISYLTEKCNAGTAAA